MTVSIKEQISYLENWKMELEVDIEAINEELAELRSRLYLSLVDGSTIGVVK